MFLISSIPHLLVVMGIVNKCLYGVILLLVFPPFALSGTLELIYQDNSSTKHVLEFRARGSSLLPPSVGHAWVALGYELDNGVTHFYSASGFYPGSTDGVFEAIKATVDSPGRLDFTVPDMSQDEVFRVSITPAQRARVHKALKKFDSQNYDLLSNNCVSMMRDIASTLELSKGLAILPSDYVKRLREANSSSEAIQNEADVSGSYRSNLELRVRDYNNGRSPGTTSVNPAIALQKGRLEEDEGSDGKINLPVNIPKNDCEIDGVDNCTLMPILE